MSDRRMITQAPQPTGLADLLERVLDKGVVVAGDIKILLADVELLSIKIRLVVCSVEKALAMGINWWMYDPYLRGGLDEPKRLTATEPAEKLGPGGRGGQGVTEDE